MEFLSGMEPVGPPGVAVAKYPPTPMQPLQRFHVGLIKICFVLPENPTLVSDLDRLNHNRVLS